MKRTLLPALVWCLACGSETPPPVTPTPPAGDIDQSFRTQRPSPLPPVPIEHPEPQLAQLGNGFSLWVIERNSPTLSLRVTCRIGSRDNPESAAGLAAITQRMLTEGTTKRSALELAISAESLGTSLRESSSRDSSSLQLEVLPEHEEQAIELLAEVLRQPAFRAEDFERVRAEWLDDLTVQRQDPTQLSWLLGYRALLGPRLGLGSQGTPSHIRKLELSRVKSFYEANWSPDRCALLAVGPTTTSNVEGVAAELFGNWQPGKPRRPEPELPLLPQGRTTVYVLDRPGSVQTAIFVAGLVPKRYEPGHEAREVLNNLFGGLFTSRLNTNLREKNAYSYGAFSSLVTTRDWGLWVISTSVETSVTAPALQEVRNELAQLRAPGSIRLDEIERARTDLSFRVSAHLEHTSSLLEELHELFVYEIDTDYFRNQSAMLNDVGLEHIASQLGHVPDRAHVIAIVGDQRKLLAQGLLDEHTRSVGLQWIDGAN